MTLIEVLDILVQEFKVTGVTEDFVTVYTDKEIQIPISLYSQAVQILGSKN